MEFKENTDFDLIGLGEVMLRLSPPNKEKISQSETFEKNAGGSELNVVSGAAMLGIRSAIVTKLPENKMGHFIRNKIRYGNVSDDSPPHLTEKIYFSPSIVIIHLQILQS